MPDKQKQEDTPSNKNKNHITWPLVRGHLVTLVLFLVKRPASVLLPILFIYFAFFIPPEESRFMKDVRRLFESSGQSEILLKELVSIDWDTVCYVGEYTSPKDMPEYLYDELSSLPHSMRKYSPFYMGSFLFVNDGKLVKRLTYHGWGLRLTTDGLYPLHAFIEGRRYLFLSQNAFEKNYCADKQTAAFAIRTSFGAREPTYKIVFTEYNSGDMK